MDRDQLAGEIAEHYRHLRDYRYSEKYSGEDKTVFTAPDQRYWLVVEQMAEQIMQARLSDENGVVTAWDNYDTSGGGIMLCEAVRRSESGREKISFTADELKEIHRIEDGQGTGMTYKDGAVYSAAGKMCRLSEESCAELCATAGRVYGVSSLSARLERAGRRAETERKERTKEKRDYKSVIYPSLPPYETAM